MRFRHQSGLVHHRLSSGMGQRTSSTTLPPSDRRINHANQQSSVSCLQETLVGGLELHGLALLVVWFVAASAPAHAQVLLGLAERVGWHACVS